MNSTVLENRSLIFISDKDRKADCYFWIVDLLVLDQRRFYLTYSYWIYIERGKYEKREVPNLISSLIIILVTVFLIST